MSPLAILESATDDDPVDLDALKRLWPMDRYGRHGDWFQFVGYTRPMRNALVARRPARGSRGLIRTQGGRVWTRSKFSGEFVARETR